MTMISRYFLTIWRVKNDKYYSLCFTFFDVLVVFFLFQTYKKNPHLHTDVILEVTEERRQITELTNEIKNIIDTHTKQTENKLNKISQIASEAEEFLADAKKTISNEVINLAEKLPSELKPTFIELSSKQNLLEKTLVKVDEKIVDLKKIIKDCDKYQDLISGKNAVEDALQEIEENKYLEARRMLSKGFSDRDIFEATNLKQAELELIKK